MVANENDAYRTSKESLDALILRDGYRRYMIQTYTEEKRNGNGGINVKRIVKFDIQALRKYLEENKIVRKFGF